MSAERAKLTAAQRDLLEMALRARAGNPWPLVPIRRRKGGALSRCFEKMREAGLFDRSNCITEARRAALAGDRS